jgi:hypothetical protein
MKHSYLEVTYRKGRVLAAYFYLPREANDISVRTERLDGGLVVDFASDGRPIGIEITSPSQFDLSILNQALSRLGQQPLPADDLAPLAAA